MSTSKMVDAFEIVVVRRQQLGANISLFLHRTNKNTTWQLYIFFNTYFYGVFLIIYPWNDKLSTLASR